MPMQLSTKSIGQIIAEKPVSQIVGGINLNNSLTGVAIRKNSILLADAAVHGAEWLDRAVGALRAALQSSHGHV